MLYINIHTHKTDENKNGFFIENLFPDEVKNIEAGRSYSLGLHPWNIKPDGFEGQISIIEKYVGDDQIVAIGEMGLDKFAESSLNLQKDIFRRQALIANRYGKPVIVHCVKAFGELLGMDKDINDHTPWIIHGFKGSAELGMQLINKGIYLSFGNAFFHHEKTAKCLEEIPIEYCFLETDDEDVCIEDVYQKAAEIKNVPVEQLAASMEKNLKAVFSDKRFG